LKPWEQLRELNFWFDNFGVLLVYYLDVKRVSLYIGPTDPFDILSEVATHGFEFPTLDPRTGRKDFHMFEDRGEETHHQPRPSTWATLNQHSSFSDPSSSWTHRDSHA
jgi:hypothetical protein